MPLLLSIFLLCLSPIAIVIAIGGALTLINNFRKGFGAHQTLPTAAVIAALVAAVLHGGFFLAPLLLYAGHVKTALLLVAPVSLVAGVGLVWVLIGSTGITENYKRIATIVYSLLAAYLLPVIVLAMHVR